MLVSFRAGLALLAMPKCASHALIDAYGAEADLVVRHPPGLKHSNLRQFRRRFDLAIRQFAAGEIETACLMREPIDWLHSWWRYRARPQIAGRPQSTAALPFPDFVAAYLEGAPGPAEGIGRPAAFVGDGRGGLGVDHLWRYDALPAFTQWLEARTGWSGALRRVNVSPGEAGAPALPAPLAARAETVLAADFALYRDIARAGVTRRPR